MRNVVHAVCVVAVIVCLVGIAPAEDPYPVEWKRQIGTSGFDYSRCVAVDASGNAYVSGGTDGDLGGPNAGNNDVFVRKFDSGGNEVWTTQFGTSASDGCHSIAVDASGNSYVSGRSAGGMFVGKLDPSGNELWRTRFGATSSDRAYSVAVDTSGNAYVSGFTDGDLGGPNAGYWDAFLSKFDSDGNVLWSSQIGTSGSDESWSVAVGASGNAYISGFTSGDLGGGFDGYHDAFLSKFDAEGNELWTTQIGASNSHDRSYSVAVDEFDNAYISGYTEGDLAGPNAGFHDVFLSKFDADGNEVWRTQTGTNEPDRAHSIALDSSGNSYVSGSTWGDLGGPTAGYWDAFLSKFDAEGNEVWTTQIGTDRDDQSWSVAVDASGNAYISGFTNHDLGGPWMGANDAFLVKYAAATPLRSVSAVDIAAGFAPGGGAHGLGELTAVGAADVVVEDVNDQQTTYAGGSFEMTASLLADNSAGGLAAGEFSGGALVFRDSGGADLLTGDLIELLLYEVGNDMGMLAGSGLFEVTGGSLQAGFLETHGEIFQMFFQVTPSNIDNFAAAFTGFTDITITPIPEPATMWMLALGGLAALRRRRRRTAKASLRDK